MKRFFPLLVVFGAGLAASLALASPPPGHGPPTSASSTSGGHGKSGDHAKAKCRPVNLKGTVAAGTIALNVTKAAGANAQQFANATANLSVSGNVSVQAWSCGAASGATPTAPQALYLKQLHVGGSPQQPGSTSGTATGQCRPANLKGTVAAGTIALNVTKAAGAHAKQFAGTTANLTVSGKVSVQAWSCSAASSGGSTASPTLFLKQLHVGGSPQAVTTTTTTTTGP